LLALRALMVLIYDTVQLHLDYPEEIVLEHRHFSNRKIDCSVSNGVGGTTNFNI